MKLSEIHRRRAAETAAMGAVAAASGLGVLAWALNEGGGRALETAGAGFFLLAVFLTAHFAGEWRRLRRLARLAGNWERQMTERGLL